MDYKELIELSQKAANEWRGDHTFYQAGVLIDSLCTAIEPLLAELDAAVDMLHGECHACKHNTVWHNVGKCTTCKHETAGAILPKDQCDDNWQWRGLQKEEES